MARPLRIEYPGAFYHVMNRGNAGEDIFISIRDKERFTEYLEKSVERFSIIIHTYCLMSNHYHLLVETPQPNLSLAMQWLNVSYASYHNRKRHRSGHLFQGRFKSILVDADEYLKHLSRYIHLNPVRAKIVEKPEGYHWSSYRAFIGTTKAPKWLETDWLLSTFGKKRKAAAQNYKAFVDEVDGKTLEDPAKDLVGGFILGDSDFVNWVKESLLSNKNDEKEIPQLKQLKPRVSLDAIIQSICASFGSTEKQIREKGRKGNKARDFAIYLARDLTGSSCKELGNFFGDVSGAAITVRYKYIARQAKRDRKLTRELKKIKGQILNN
ncbi:MAG: transposase [Desulfobacterales bacterium]|nr:transposase [Desulfobacterales bacterium]